MDPLSQLRDIHLPAPVGLWPLAPGWWIVAALLLALGITVFLLIQNRIRRGAPKRNALRELDGYYRTFRDNGNQTEYVIKINLLLKKLSVNYYDKGSVAKLSGDAWLAFLDQHSDADSFTRGAGAVLATGPYSNNVSVDADALRRACKQWISAHD